MLNPGHDHDSCASNAELDALIAAASATGARSVSVLHFRPGELTSRTEHIVTIDLGESSRADFDALVAKYGAPPGIDRFNAERRWLQSRLEIPGTNITLTLLGAWQHRAESATDTTAA